MNRTVMVFSTSKCLSHEPYRVLSPGNDCLWCGKSPIAWRDFYFLDGKKYFCRICFECYQFHLKNDRTTAKTVRVLRSGEQCIKDVIGQNYVSNSKFDRITNTYMVIAVLRSKSKTEGEICL